MQHRRDRPYERLNITGIQDLTDAQKLSLKMMGAIEQDNAGEKWRDRVR